MLNLLHYDDFILIFSNFSQKLKVKTQNSSKKPKVSAKKETWFAENESKKQACRTQTFNYKNRNRCPTQILENCWDLNLRNVHTAY